MRSFMEFMERYFVPIAGKIGSQRHLVAVRDGFVSIMPLILAGSFAVLFNNTLFKWIPFLTPLSGVNGNVWWGTFAIMTLLVVFSIGYNLAKGYNVDALAAGLISVGAFLTVTPQAHGNAGWGYIHWGYLNAGGLFTGILVSLIATEIFVKLRKKNLIIKMPDNVPPAVGKAFAAVIPGTVTLFVFGILAFILASINVNSLHDLIFNSIQKPLQGFGQGLGSAVLLATLMNLFWFFGLHGGNILDPVINAIYLPALETNAALVQQGAAATNLVTKSFFDSFVHLGGCGATLALILAIFLVSKKRKDYREVAKLGAPNGIFNINEPMMFGLPIILNPVLLIPFLLIPGILTTIAYMATVSGIVPPTYVQVPWITPVGISGFLATGGNIMGAILGLVNFAIATLIYMPFVMLAERIDTDRKEEKELNSSKTLSI
jgi:cellobiose PTS system EIIC component